MCAFNVLAQGVVCVTRQVSGNITPYITPCQSGLQFVAIDTQSVTRLRCFVFGCAIVTSENGTSIQFHPQLIAWFSLMLNEGGRYHTHPTHSVFSCIAREETHCIRQVISNGGTRRKLPGKYNEPPDPDKCAYPLTCVVVVIRELVTT